jgi:PAS domain S-box-containing protein
MVAVAREDADAVWAELRKAGCEIIPQVVSTREELSRSLCEFRPDAVLSDCPMPGFTALEVLDMVKPLGIPFILIAAESCEDEAVHCVSQGAKDYLLKPALKRLPSAIRNAIQFRKTARERERTLDALNHSEQRFRLLIESALDFILILKPDMTFGYASPSMRELGYTPRELDGKSMLDFIGADDVQEFERFFHAAFQPDNQPKKTEFLFRHAHGTFRVLEAIGKAIQLDASTPGVVLNARDITERRQAEETIEKLAAFARFNPNPVFELDASGRINYWNQAAQDLAKAVGVSPSTLLPADVKEVIAQSLKTGEGNLRRETRIADRTYTWAFFPIIPSQVVHGYALDITERVALEKHVRQIQKMESIGQLAAGIAHDYNNVLTVIQGYSDILLHRPMDAETRNSVEQISISAERATGLTRQLLAFSRRQVMLVKPLDLSELIANMTRRLRQTLGDGIALQFNYTPNLPLAQADTAMLEQVLTNLALNARDALPKGGIVSIGTECVKLSAADVQSNPEAREGEFVCLRFSDNGMGIESDVLPRIFEPFFTTKEVGRGSGLGLATVYGIVKQLKGWVDVTTEKGQGTVFRVYLPVSQQDACHDPNRMVTDSHSSGSETVLVVEDEPRLRGLVCGILRRHGYQVLEAASGDEAVEIWNQSKIDLLFMDLVLPGGMAGSELAERFCAERPSVKVIFTSGYSVETIPAGLTIKNGLNFLQKPYHPAVLIKVIRACLDA